MTTKDESGVRIMTVQAEVRFFLLPTESGGEKLLYEVYPDLHGADGLLTDGILAWHGLRRDWAAAVMHEAGVCLRCAGRGHEPGYEDVMCGDCDGSGGPGAPAELRKYRGGGPTQPETVGDRSDRGDPDPQWGIEQSERRALGSGRE